MTSFRIMQTEDFGDSVFYRATCACGIDDHDLALILEFDEDLPDMVTLVMFKDLVYASYWEDSLWGRFKKRILGTLRMLFTGYIKVEESFIFQGERQIDEFINALQEGMEKIKKVK